MKKHSLQIISLLSLLIFCGCAAMETATTVATDIAVQRGTITKEQAASIRTGTTAVTRSLEEFTPEQEYYIGRSVGAVVLTKYKALNDAKVNSYVNLLGQTLALASDTPELFAGYHFLVLDSDDINAFATPGGHIFITRGLIRCCRTEDELAAVLAHEIGHIQMRHGMKAIQKARMTEALTILAREGVKTYGDEELIKLSNSFGDVISDITTTLINNGYSRAYEYEADTAAITILRRAGYQTGALVNMLQVMGKQLRPGGIDFARTHPSPQLRIMELQNNTGISAAAGAPDVRTKRFSAAVGHLL
ncbi:MAG TPA: M48 family metalloprotease [Smithellaceae bacterium]|nr:M48 family metalloprotease [Smithellaceae bacterium]HRS88547.1 M48 family metalloprotease [Smithellaceae bacterium]HRV25301.1 M48 family metalloprotease [Smithellaceae bacterium]